MPHHHHHHHRWRSSLLRCCVQIRPKYLWHEKWLFANVSPSECIIIPFSSVIFLLATHFGVAKRDDKDTKWLLPHFHLDSYYYFNHKNVNLSNESLFFYYFYCNLRLQWRWVNHFFFLLVENFSSIFHTYAYAPNRPINLNVIHPNHDNPLTRSYSGYLWWLTLGVQRLYVVDFCCSHAPFVRIFLKSLFNKSHHKMQKIAMANE